MSSNIINEIMSYAQKAGYPKIEPVGLLSSRGGYGKFNPSAGHHIVDPILRDKNPIEPINFSLTERCLRENDSSKIGISNRHLSFFEMLEFTQVGDKEKLDFEKNIVDSYNIMTKVLGLDKDKILITYLENCKIDNIHLTSKETERVSGIWKKLLGEDKVIPTKGRRNLFIARIPDSAGGPGYEVYYKLGKEDHVEIASQLNYNMIFHGQDNIQPTINQVICCVFGLERLIMAIEGKEKVHDISLIKPLKDEVIIISNQEKQLYDENVAKIADSIRAISFIMYDSDGKELSGSQRKILKNIVKELKSQVNYLGIEDNKIYERLIQTNIDLYNGRFPDFVKKKDKIIEVITRI